jgi:hypothetical protein
MLHVCLILQSSEVAISAKVVLVFVTSFFFLLCAAGHSLWRMHVTSTAALHMKTRSLVGQIARTGGGYIYTMIL